MARMLGWVVVILVTSACWLGIAPGALASGWSIHQTPTRPPRRRGS
jgi:hypothetical protein